MHPWPHCIAVLAAGCYQSFRLQKLLLETGTFSPCSPSTPGPRLFSHCDRLTTVASGALEDFFGGPINSALQRVLIKKNSELFFGPGWPFQINLAAPPSPKSYRWPHFFLYDYDDLFLCTSHIKCNVHYFQSSTQIPYRILLKVKFFQVSKTKSLTFSLVQTSKAINDTISH